VLSRFLPLRKVTCVRECLWMIFVRMVRTLKGSIRRG